MMQQAVHVHDLFTGHKELEDMHFDQQCRLYEFHRNEKINIEHAEKIEDCALQNFKGGFLQSMATGVKDTVLILTYSSRPAHKLPKRWWTSLSPA